MSTPLPAEKIRLDRWLWAARFFKTRALAKKAVESGKVHCNDQRTKPGKTIRIGDILTIRQGHEIKTLVGEGLSSQRRNAEHAAGLYEETPESRQKRLQASTARRLQSPQGQAPARRPDKKQRRALQQLHQKTR
jgi:ribosome-associated heat shock protein Hsp15